MSDLNPNQRIYDVTQAIHQGRYRIPNIQRGYEWEPDRIAKLLDSIMSGYPIGAIMVWRPTEEIRGDIQTRRFFANFDSSQDYLSEALHPADQGTESYLVLDGQQRLQSLYLSFFGSYNGQRVHLQIDHVPTDQDDDTDFAFEFLTPDEARAQPEMLHLADIIRLDSTTKFAFIMGLAQKLTASITNPDHRTAAINEKQAAIAANIDRVIERFNIKQTLLFQEVESRHNYDHVLEIFERVNSGGMVLDKSDLLFSTLKMKLQGMERRFIESVNFLNQDSRHSFNTDFLIKTSLVVFGQRAKYDVAKLKDHAFTATLEEKFGELNTCIRQMMAWLEDVARVKCARFLRSRLALIPILDYMMLSGHRDKPEGENGSAMAQYLYMASFRRLFSRAPDNVLDQLHDLMVKAVEKNPGHFPIERLREFMVRRQNAPFTLDDHHFAADADLMLNIVDGGVLQIDPTDPKRHPKDLKLEVDHIFPRKKLDDLGLADLADHIGNYRLLVMPANRRKSANMPDDGSTGFFGRELTGVAPLYRAALSNLSRETYLAFRDARAALIRQEVEDFLGLSDLADVAKQAAV